MLSTFYFSLFFSSLKLIILYIYFGLLYHLLIEHPVSLSMECITCESAIKTKDQKHDLKKNLDPFLEYI